MANPQAGPWPVIHADVRPSVEASVLFDDLELRPAEPVQRPTLPVEVLKLRVPNRDQLIWARIDLEEWIPPTHKARAIWDLTGKLDLSRFYEGRYTVKGQAGAPGWAPRLLVSIWVYMLSEGVGSAREIERLMEHEPGLMWLSGRVVINHHTLSDFRTAHQQALDELFTRLLALLEGEGLITMELAAHDGTKIEAQAGSDSFRREKTVRERLERARQWVERLKQEEPQEGNPRRQAAQLRAAREQRARLEQALNELTEIQAAKKSAEEKQEARVSITEPEARIMKGADQGFAPAYNAQITTDSANKVIVAVEVTQCSADAPALLESLDQAEQRMDQPLQQAVVDGGYVSEENIVGAEAKQIDLIGALPETREAEEKRLQSLGIAPGFGPSGFVVIEDGQCLQCPAGKLLPYARPSKKGHRRYRQYQAAASDCAACPLRAQCCPKNKGTGRSVKVLIEEHPSVVAFRQKMSQPEAQQIYKRRGEVAEFPNAWIKEKIGLRKFRLRGWVKVKTETLWACLTYNVMIWIRLVWRPKLNPVAV